MDNKGSVNDYYLAGLEESKNAEEVGLVICNERIGVRTSNIEFLEGEIAIFNDLVNSSDTNLPCNVCSEVTGVISSVKTTVNLLLDHIKKAESKITLLEDEITDLKSEKLSLEEKAYKDPLTGLYNRRYLEKIIAANIENSEKKHNFSFGVGFIDLDYFKKVNDTYGHDAGDMVLKSFSSFMVETFKKVEMATNKKNEKSRRKNGKRNIVFRYGGEEFVVLSSIGTRPLKMLLEKCIDTFSKIVHKHDGNEFSVNFSAGIAEYKPGEKMNNDIFDLTKRADKALYKAKELGRKRVEISSE